HRDGDVWQRSTDIVGVDVDGLVRLVSEDERGQNACVVAGDLTDEARARLAALGERVWIAPPALSVRRPAVLAEIAWRAWRKGETPGPQAGEPIYLTRAEES
ncbi:MAG TPA: hypothetical protein VEQ11_22200, partial [Chloroflexota bacterium]|nr:hypothetical protein [Chloroflexota bacterium]